MRGGAGSDDDGSLGIIDSGTPFALCFRVLMSGGGRREVEGACISIVHDIPRLTRRQHSGTVSHPYISIQVLFDHLSLPPNRSSATSGEVALFLRIQK